MEPRIPACCCARCSTNKQRRNSPSTVAPEMRIKLVSDLHIEEWRHKPFDWAEGSCNVDVLVSSGACCPGMALGYLVDAINKIEAWDEMADGSHGGAVQVIAGDISDCLEQTRQELATAARVRI